MHRHALAIDLAFVLGTLVLGLQPVTPWVTQWRSTTKSLRLRAISAEQEYQDKQQQDKSDDASLVEWNPSDDESGDVHIPSAGISVFDEMDASQRDRFVSELLPLRGIDRGAVAQIVSSPIVRDSLEPLRYLVALAPPQVQANATNDDGEPLLVNATFAMVDVPPFSPQLAARMRSYMGLQHRLEAILVTSRDAIHYDQAEAVFSNRRADLHQWKQAFPGVQVIAYRLDIPRDCQGMVSQRLDGYGPFAAAPTTQGNFSFCETGRPLVYEEWDYKTAQDVLSGQTTPPDDDIDEAVVLEDADDYTPQAIRGREEGKAILAIYTPGHSFGSVSYVFPETKVCCSGFTVPVEDSRIEDNEGFATGPALDVRGYITTSRAGILRQMTSARHLVTTYADRFHTILPSRGGPLTLGGSTQERQEELLATIDQYERIGQIYEQLGITSSSDDSDLNE
jgi:hypothetical protein